MAVSAASRRRSVLDLKTEHVNMCVYGLSGVGKTVLGATGPPPVLFLDVDFGMMSVSRMRPDLQKSLGIDDLNQLKREIVRGQKDIERLLQEVREEFKADPHAYGTIVLDNITELQRVLMNEYVREQSAKGLPKQQDWQYILLQMRWVVQNIRALPCHKLFTAHLEEKEGMKSPALSGRIAQELPGYFDILACYMLREEEVTNADTGEVSQESRRGLWCQAHPRIAAKDRSGRLDMIERPHLGHIVRKISGLPEEE